MMMMMVMEGQEEAAVNNLSCQDQLQIINKGKRTKRPRPMAAPSTSTTTTTSSGGDEGDHDSKVFDECSEEEEDMANCLILLAQGGRTRSKPSSVAETISKTTSSTAAAGIYVHQCKTCNRSFPSFQALGGHRASHKKPKIDINEEQSNKGFSTFGKEDHHHHHQFNNTTMNLSLQLSNNKAVLSNNSSKLAKVHECSICGAEFSSGQALGGHMRRHRTLITNNSAATITTTTTTSLMSVDQESKKPRNVLQLDLNLPAPEDIDHHHHQSRESKFPFASSKEKLLVFSASNLVNCHY